MKIDKTRVKKILLINLSNIGDAVLTTPVIQVLRDSFPQAHLAALVGPRAFAVFKSDHRLDMKIIYDKAISWKNKIRLISRLKREKYDLVVDLRHTLFALFLGAKYHTAILARPPKHLLHMKDKHLWKLTSLGLEVDYACSPTVIFSQDEQNNVQNLLDKWQLKPQQGLIAIAAGARNKTKCWEKSGYIQLIKRLGSELKAKIVLVGDENDLLVTEEIASQVNLKTFNSCGKTSVGELACLLKKCKLLVTNDSAPMHLAWAVGIPVVALFGPTDPRKYAPGGADAIVIRKNLACAPCNQSLCFDRTRNCLKLISADEVFCACQKVFNGQ